MTRVPFVAHIYIYIYIYTGEEETWPSRFAMIVPVGEAGDGEERERQSGASFTWSDWDDLSSHIHDLQLQVDRLQSRLETVEERLTHHQHHPGSGAGTEHHRPGDGSGNEHLRLGDGMEDEDQERRRARQRAKRASCRGMTGSCKHPCRTYESCVCVCVWTVHCIYTALQVRQNWTYNVAGFLRTCSLEGYTVETGILDGMDETYKMQAIPERIDSLSCAL